MQPAPSTPGPWRAADTCRAPPGPERPPAARGRAAASSLGPASASGRAPRGLDMSAQEPSQGRRFPIEAGDSPGLAAAPESQDSPEPVATEHNPVRSPPPRQGPAASPEPLRQGPGALPGRVASSIGRVPLSPGRFDAARAATA
ncbi:protein FAM229A isoform X1 [Panthera onca]|uniref:protein FAM229A isoform X1 n=1 Tax=Panthera onca TaxID=9690 RepID=UPI002955A6BD|nr:protein FAM229A isoform X1 [Panthera onca]